MDETQQTLWTAVDDYADGLFTEEDAGLEAARRSAADEGMPTDNVSPSQGRLLEILTRMASARRVLEVGTLAGYSTLWFARALPPQGRVTSIEKNQRYAEVARSNVARAGMEDRVEILEGDAAEVLEDLVRRKAGPFDLVFIDADKPANPVYLRLALELTRPGSVIIGDNVVRGGGVLRTDGTDPKAAGVRRFFEDLAANPRLITSVVQTVGRKGYDGMSVSVVLDGDHG